MPSTEHLVSKHFICSFFFNKFTTRSVFLAGAEGATQAAFIWILNNGTFLYNAVVSPYADCYASNSNELLMRLGKWMTMLLPILGYADNSISFDSVGSLMMNFQLGALAANCFFQLSEPIKGFLAMATAGMNAAKESARGLMPEKFALDLSEALSSSIELPAIPQMDTA